MGIGDTETGWGWTTRLIHWFMAILIVVASVIGLVMDTNDLGDFDLIQTHKSWGALILPVAVAQILWRLLRRRSPDLPEAMPNWQRRASALTHLAMNLLVLAIPLSGWLMVSASPLQDMGVRNMFFGLFEMPDPFPTGDGKLSDALAEVHGAVWNLLALVLGLHVSAALYHHFVQRDRILTRMIVGK